MKALALGYVLLALFIFFGGNLCRFSLRLFYVLCWIELRTFYVCYVVIALNFLYVIYI